MYVGKKYWQNVRKKVYIFVPYGVRSGLALMGSLYERVDMTAYSISKTIFFDRKKSSSILQPPFQNSPNLQETCSLTWNSFKSDIKTLKTYLITTQLIRFKVSKALSSASAALKRMVGILIKVNYYFYINND